MTEQAAVYEIQRADERPLTAVQVRAQVNLIQEVMKSVFQNGQHYGVIPGAGTKPTLLKPGAEKLMLTFHLSPDPIVEDLSTSDYHRYRVTCRINTREGHFLGAGLGEASSNEEKYKWRAAICPEEFDETPEDRKRKKWKKGYQGAPATSISQVRTEPADIANTILKMAKKRALVDAALTVTGASDIFTQDVEDLPEEMLNRSGHAEKPAPKPPEKKAEPPNKSASAPAADAPVFATVFVLSVEEKTGQKKDGTPYTMYIIKDGDGEKYQTFSDTHCDVAHQAKREDKPVTIGYVNGQYGRKITSIDIAEGPLDGE